MPAPPPTAKQISDLPDLCQDLIYRYLHNMYMKDLSREIQYNVVWVRLRSGNHYRYQFLTSTQTKFTTWDSKEI